MYSLVTAQSVDISLQHFVSFHLDYCKFADLSSVDLITSNACSKQAVQSAAYTTHTQKSPGHEVLLRVSNVYSRKSKDSNNFRAHRCSSRGCEGGSSSWNESTHTSKPILLSATFRDMIGAQLRLFFVRMFTTVFVICIYPPSCAFDRVNVDCLCSEATLFCLLMFQSRVAVSASVVPRLLCSRSVCC